ncbi:hypothetical protein MKK75_07580 [Methylobacterium sp. J-030]|uniref:hypothetical protein n=1 Tax=Methylobacterium sp. J-030 TaxID=2836627 RepID=UPI001FB93E39|nr:hypothetical protein [Methylobacterium sp. J-030]MCJ2068662.1 hypothetical protein [Methylobacterium sp. J-030]
MLVAGYQRPQQVDHILSLMPAVPSPAISVAGNTALTEWCIYTMLRLSIEPHLQENPMTVQPALPFWRRLWHRLVDLEAAAAEASDEITDRRLNDIERKLKHLTIEIRDLRMDNPSR